jgi:hypothetical protein
LQITGKFGELKNPFFAVLSRLCLLFQSQMKLGSFIVEFKGVKKTLNINKYQYVSKVDFEGTFEVIFFKGYWT